MNMNGSSTRTISFAVVGTLLTFLLVSAAALAQDTSTTNSSQSGQATYKTEVKSGEVVYVSGNDLVVKADDGQVKHFVVPEDTKFNVDGKDLSVHELTPGMRLTRTITTTTVPKTIQTVRTIKGTVWYVNPPSTVILTLPNNTNKQYKVPKGQMFDLNGEKHDVFDLRKGMKISATVITETPETVESNARELSGQAPPPPPTPPAVGALLIEDPTPAPAPEVAQAALPKTGSMIPLIGLLGLLCVGTSLVLKASRA